MLQRVLERRRPIIKGAVVCMILSVAIGILAVPTAFFGLTMPPPPIEVMIREGMMTGLNTTAVVFWISFLLVFLNEMLKSDAVSEFDRLVMLGEELYKRGRAPRSPEIPRDFRHHKGTKDT